MDRNWRVDCPKLNELVGKLNKLLLADGRDNILGKLDAAKEQWDAAEKYKKDLQSNSDRPKSRELGKRRWEYFENVVAKEQSLRDLDPKEPFDGHIWEVHERLVTLQEEREVFDGHLADFYCPCGLDLGKTNLLPDALVGSIVIYGWVPPHLLPVDKDKVFHLVPPVGNPCELNRSYTPEEAVLSLTIVHDAVFDECPVVPKEHALSHWLPYGLPCSRAFHSQWYTT